MEKELPISLNDLIILNLYLGSLTMLLGIALLAFVIFKNGKFNWTKFILISVFLFILGSSFSLMIWVHWNLPFDIMLGPIHLPTLLSVVVVGLILIKLFKLDIIKRKTNV